MMRLTIKLVLTILVLIAGIARADMYVDRSIVVFEADGEQRQDVKVSNSGADVMYVQIEVFQVNDPGTPAEERIKVTDPKSIKLLATPSKLVIPPGGQKLVRLMNLDKEQRFESVYRINVTPIVAPLAEEESQLRIVVAYQILAIIQPRAPATELVAERTGRSITFTNDGNTNILLSDGQQCQAADTGDCRELASHRLYAGNAWTLELPFDGPVAYSVRTYDGIRQQVFP